MLNYDRKLLLKSALKCDKNQNILKCLKKSLKKKIIDVDKGYKRLTEIIWKTVSFKTKNSFVKFMLQLGYN